MCNAIPNDITIEGGDRKNGYTPFPVAAFLFVGWDYIAQ